MIKSSTFKRIILICKALISKVWNKLNVSLLISGKFIREKNVWIADYSQIVIGKEGTLVMKEGSGIGRNNRLTCLEYIEIGKNTITGSCVNIMDNKHKTELKGIPYKKQGYETKPTIIGDNVWIGANCTILYGVTIGNNAIIGANSVVRTNVPENTMYAGCPAVYKKSLKEMVK